MDESVALCIAIEEGADCPAEATMITPAPLCARHQLQIALLVIPDVLTTAVRHAGTDMKPVSLAPDERAAVIAGARPKATGAYMGGVHGSVVYFLENGDRVKIGHSTNLRNRVRSLSLQEKDVALLLQGGLTLERALHATYAKERIDATEWFMKSDRIAEFIKSKLTDLNGRRAPMRQHQPTVPMQASPRARRKAMVQSNSKPWPTSDCALLAVPLYRKYVANHNGARPTASTLVALLRNAHPNVMVPGSSRSERNIRMAAEVLIAEEDGNA